MGEISIYELITAVTLSSALSFFSLLSLQKVLGKVWQRILVPA